MRILFMGTPDFALEALKALAESKHTVLAAVTQPDKPKGRGYKMIAPPVKEYANSLNIPVYQPDTLKNGELENVLDEYCPEVIVVAAYGKILPKYVIDYPKYGCINIHASLLPKYRGAAPIQWSVINGDEKTGVTIMQMNYGLDTGDIILKRETPIGEYETAGELFQRLAKMGGSALLEALELIETGNAVKTAQDEEKSTYAPMIKKEMARIDWNKSAREVSKLICGMNPWPIAFTCYKGEIMKVLEAKMCDSDENGENGKILDYVKGEGLKVKCGTGAVYIKKLQFSAGKKMSVDDYLRGHSIDIGEVLS
ncbi:MAG: methionyl-tRNA formyltransferase [Clostridia bacterium]|nr:methionyl-tRNA formyltransferase [Clostridia bacterium]